MQRVCNPGPRLVHHMTRTSSGVKAEKVFSWPSPTKPRSAQLSVLAEPQLSSGRAGLAGGQERGHAGARARAWRWCGSRRVVMRRGGDSRAPMLTIECVGPQEFWGPPRAALITPRRGRVGPRPGGASRSHGACALHRVDANAVRGGDHPHARAILPAQIGRCCGQLGRSRSAPMSTLPCPTVVARPVVPGLMLGCRCRPTGNDRHQFVAALFPASIAGIPWY